MRLFVLIGGLILLVLIAALIGPYFVDWGNYRDRFETEAGRILGQEVRVEGAASARLIPFPSVTFTDVRVGPRGAANITIEEFSMDAELAPFLSGEILIFDMRLVSPVIRLDLDEQGRPIWNWPSQTPVDPAQITLESATFSDGTLLLRDRKYNRQWDFTGLNGTAAADSLFGPWRIEGDGLIRGAYIESNITTGLLSRDGFSTKIAASLPESNITITTDGRVAPPSAQSNHWYSGAFNIKPTEGSVGAWRLEGVFEADANSFLVDQFRGDFGTLEDPYTINGSAEIIGGTEPRFSLEAKGNQFNVLGDDSAQGSFSVSDRLSALQGVLATLPFPPIPGNVNLDLPALVAGNTTVRDIKLRASPNPNGRGWSVLHAEAKLPGRTLVEAKGSLTLSQGNNQDSQNMFSGELLLASRQPSGLAGWLTEDVDEVIRLLPSAGFSAKVELGPDRQRFDDLEVRLGDASFAGRIERRASLESLPFIAIDLAGEKPDLKTIDALTSVMLGRDGAFRLLNHDVDVSLDLTDADISGVTLGHVNTDLRIRGDRIEVDKFLVEEMFGGSISATGTFVRSGAADNPDYAVSWDAGLVAVDGGPLVLGISELIGAVPGVEDLVRTAERDPFAFSDVSLNSVGSARLPSDGPAEASASISGEFGGTDVSFTSTMSGQPDKPASVIGTLSGTVENEEATTLLSQAGFEIFPLRLLGQGKSLINMSGNLDEGLSTRVTLETPDTNISLDGVFRTAIQGVGFTGTGDVNSADIEPWWDLFGYIFPSTGLGTDAAANARIRFEDGVYTFSEVSGSVGGNAFGGEVSVQSSDGSPKIVGDVSLNDLDLSFLISILTGRYDLSDETGLFAEPLYDDHTIDLQVKADTFGTVDAIMEDATLRLIYRDSAFSLNGLAAKAGSGQVTGTADLQNVDGSIIMNGQLSMQDIPAAQIMPALKPTLDVKSDMNLAFSANGKSIEGFIGSLTGSGVIKTQETALPGINPEAVDEILKNADVIGYEITDQQIETIAQSETMSGSMTIAAIEQPISIASGIVRADNVSVAQAGTVLAGSLAYDLESQTLSGEGRLTYDAAEQSVTGLLPEVDLSFSQTDAGSDFVVTRDYTLMMGFVRQRALEREQARVEALQARLLDKQRFRREIRLLRYERTRELRLAEETRLREIAAQRRQRLIEAAKLEAERVAREARLEREEQIERLLQPEAPIILPRGESTSEIDLNGDGAEPLTTEEGVAVDPQIQDNNIFENLEELLSTGDL